MADNEDRGFLTFAGFALALRLIGHAQAGRQPTAAIALQRGPIPRFDGLANTVTPTHTGTAPIQQQTTGTPAPNRFPPLTPERVSQYTALFERQNLQANMLPGEEAKNIFSKSGLTPEALQKVWQLADTEQRGSLVLTEFIIAMHLLTSMKSGALRALPNILPAAFYEAATRRVPPIQAPMPTGQMPRQMTGSQTQGQPPPHMAPQATGLAGPPGGGDWLVTLADKARFDQIYDGLDRERKGYIGGDEAVPFLRQSGLPEGALATIWDLSDINSDGCLNRDEFSVAMFLIRQQRSQRDPSQPPPPTLPPNLIPPNMRSLMRPTAASVFDAPAPPPQAPKSALDDLFGLESSNAPQPAAPQVPLSTGGSNANDPFAGGSAVLSPASPGHMSPPASATGTHFKPFVPQSAWAKHLTTQATGDSNGSSTRQQAPAPIAEDLLGDNDPEVSKKLTNETTELANLSNQIESLGREMQGTQAQRNTTQNDLTQANSQKKNFEQRLAQLRALYEKEAADAKSLRQQLASSRSDTQKLQGECMSLEGMLTDLRTEHQQSLTALQSDQQENASLKERIRLATAETSQLRTQLDKIKSDARQHKGLVAINKKQLITSENERDKIRADIESHANLSNLPSADASPQLRSASPPAAPAAAAQVTSPSPSVASGNNPFFRRTASTDIMGTFTSPSPKPVSDKTFDDVFGPSFSTPPTAGTPPQPAAFSSQNTGASSASAASNPSAAAVPAAPTVQTISVAAPDAPTGEAASPSSVDVFASAASTPGISAEKHSDQRPVPAGGDDSVAADPAKAKSDFDDAFASFTEGKKSGEASSADGARSFSAFNTEFPPIAELERDADTESSSDGGGFDDDFAPPNTSKRPTPHDQPATGRDEPGSTDSAAPFPPASPPTATAPATNSTPTGPASRPENEKAPAPFDDVDDDFDGLEDAKEGSADDDFATISRSGLDDFNHVFDSSPPPSQSKADSQTFVTDSSFDFAAVSTGSGPGAASASNAGMSAPAGAQKPAATGNDSQDWDSMFAGLDSPKGTAAATKPTEEPANRSFAPGRALTEAGVHDDPILKNLTGMGYARADALLALEKYDYNLERVRSTPGSNHQVPTNLRSLQAANHLASLS